MDANLLGTSKQLQMWSSSTEHPAEAAACSPFAATSAPPPLLSLLRVTHSRSMACTRSREKTEKLGRREERDEWWWAAGGRRLPWLSEGGSSSVRVWEGSWVIYAGPLRNFPIGPISFDGL